MKVQSKFILMSTAALFAIISSASAVEVPGLREVNGIRAQLDRKLRKLDKTQEQLLIEELYNERPSGYDDRKDRKEAKTFEEVRALCEQLKAAIETHGLVRYAKKECGKTQPNNLPSVASEVEVAETTPAPAQAEDRTNIITINGVDYVVEMNSSGGNGTGGQGTAGQGTGGQGTTTTTVSTEVTVDGTGGQGNQGNNPGNNPGPNDPVTPVDPVVVQPPVTPPPVTPVVRKTVAKKKKAVKKTTRIVSEPAKKKPAKRIVSEPKKVAKRPAVEAVKITPAPIVMSKITPPSVDSLHMLNISAAPVAAEKMVHLKAKAFKKHKKTSRVIVDGEKDADDMKAKSDEKSKKRSKFKGTVPESIKDIIIAKQAKDGLTDKDISNLKTKNFGAIRAEADSVHMNLTRSSSAVSAN